MSATYASISTIVSSQLLVASSNPKGSIPMALTVVTKRGITEPQEFYGKSGIKRFINEFGDTDLDYGKSGLYAKTLLESATDHLVVTRAVSATSKYSGVLLKGKIGEENLTDLSKPFKLDKVVSGINGLREEELKAFRFPVYSRDAEYGEEIYTPSAVRDLEHPNSLYLHALGDLKTGDRLVTVGDGGVSDALYAIKNIVSEGDKILQKMDLQFGEGEDAIPSIPYKVKEGLVVMNKDTLHTMPVLNIKVGDTIDLASGKKSLVVIPSSDLFEMDKENVVFKDGATILSNDVATDMKVLSKDHYTESVFRVDFDRLPGDAYKFPYKEQIKGVTEYRDVALVLPRGQGVDGDHISIEIKDSRVSVTAFTLVVYYKGVAVETFTCSPIYEKDGNGEQIFVEDIVNSRSSYIKWVSNKGMVDNAGKGIRPLNSDKARWLKNSEPHYSLQADTTLVEDVNIGDKELKLSDVSKLTLGDRLVITIPNLYQTKEYKILKIESVGDKKTVILDRPIEETKVIRQGGAIAKVDITEQDPDNNIYDGYKRFPITELLNQPQPNLEGKILKIGDSIGKVLDAGANNMSGGGDGGAIKESELILALRKMSDPEKYLYFFLGDSGFTQSAYGVELIKVARDRKITHAFLSSKLSSEFANDVVVANSNDFAGLNYTGGEFSFSTDWFKMTDTVSGRTDVMMPPSLSDLLVEAHAVSTDGIWTASAGWRKGKYFNNGLVRPKSEGERKLLYTRGINASKSKKYKGVAKFSEITGLNQDRPLQFRSVAKLAIYIVYNLQNYIEDIHFEQYDNENISDIEGDIEAFLDNILASGGIYSSKVVIGDLVNDTAVNMRKLPVYVAVNGKAFFQGVTLGLDIQQGTTTEVNLAYARTLTA